MWRVNNPNIRQNSWVKPDGNAKSRIDYWLISAPLMQSEITTDIFVSPLSDHCLISLNLSDQTLLKRRKDYWKFSSSLLKNDAYCYKIREIILEIINNTHLFQIQKWEFLKFSIRKLSIAFSKKLEMEKREKENNLVKTLLNYYSKCIWSEEDKIQISNIQSELDEYYFSKTRGAYVRSKAKWIEDGGKKCIIFL